MATTTKLVDALKEVKREASGDRISLGDVVEILNNRGFGTLLIIPTVLIILPTGAIPFLPAICSVFICLICGQMIAGRHHPWLPDRLMHASIKRSQYETAVKKGMPVFKFLDRMTHPRLKFLTTHTAQRFIACLCIILAIAIMIVAIIPFAADLPALAILFFALGISTRDGFITALGFVTLTALIWTLPWILDAAAQLPQTLS